MQTYSKLCLIFYTIEGTKKFLTLLPQLNSWLRSWICWGISIFTQHFPHEFTLPLVPNVFALNNNTPPKFSYCCSNPRFQFTTYFTYYAFNIGRMRFVRQNANLTKIFCAKYHMNYRISKIIVKINFVVRAERAEFFFRSIFN